MYSSIGHYKHPGKFGSHIGVPAAQPKFHAFIGMPRPLHATGDGIVELGSKPTDFYIPNNINDLPEGRQDAKGTQGGIFSRELQSGGQR